MRYRISPNKLDIIRQGDKFGDMRYRMIFHCDFNL